MLEQNIPQEIILSPDILLSYIFLLFMLPMMLMLSNSAPNNESIKKGLSFVCFNSLMDTSWKQRSKLASVLIIQDKKNSTAFHLKKLIGCTSKDIAHHSYLYRIIEINNTSQKCANIWCLEGLASFGNLFLMTAFGLASNNENSLGIRSINLPSTTDAYFRNRHCNDILTILSIEENYTVYNFIKDTSNTENAPSNDTIDSGTKKWPRKKTNSQFRLLTSNETLMVDRALRISNFSLTYAKIGFHESNTTTNKTCEVSLDQRNRCTIKVVKKTMNLLAGFTKTCGYKIKNWNKPIQNQFRCGKDVPYFSNDAKNRIHSSIFKLNNKLVSYNNALFT